MHLRLWLAERLVDELGATSLSSAPLVKVYARLLGCRVGRHVDLHSVPPVTGLLTLGDGCSVEPEVDLAGHWLDGGHLHIGEVRVGADARVGARSTLLPGADVGSGAEVAAGSAVFGRVPAGEAWSGAPALPSGRGARALGRATGPRTGRDGSPPTPRSAVVLSLLPVLAVLAGLAVALPRSPAADGIPDAVATAPLWLPLSTVVGSSCSPPSSSWRCGCSRSGSRPARTRCTAGRPGRRGRSCGCSTRPAPGCSPSTPRR